jgi:DNA invertase Pin-like site-specific DNA recombinase
VGLCNLVPSGQGVDTTTPGGKALFQMMAVFAEFERAMIRERSAPAWTRRGRSASGSGVQG